MEDLQSRYQLVALDIDGKQYFNVYEVLFSKATGDIVHVINPEPVELAGESVDEVMHILHSVALDIRNYGVLTQRRVEESIHNSMVEPDDYVEEELDEDISDREYDEDDLIEMMDQEYDDRGNVLDLVAFMEKNT